MTAKSIQKDIKVQGMRNIEVAVRMRPILDQFEDQQIWQVNHELNKISSVNNSNSILSQNININNSSFNTSSMMLKHKKRPTSTFGNAVQKSNRYEFVYDHAFGPMHSNKQIYHECCQSIIEQFSNKSKNGTIFMYGQTTSGKTFTMLGDQKVQGLISYSLQDICDNLLIRQDVQLSISYLQIYNEQINDLLQPGSTNLKIIDDKVHGAKQYQIYSYQQAKKLLQLGQEQRSYSQKKYHDHSSRSHTIFQIKRIQGKSKAVLNLVDLAGSERLSDDENNQQTGYINKSLFVLSNVIHRLVSNKKNVHIPYRDSKLTRLLASSLSGQSLTVVICTVSPASVNFCQTLSTLRFAACSRKVQLKPYTNSSQQSITKQQNSFVSTQSKLVTILKMQNQKLKRDITNMSFVRENYKQNELTYLNNKLRQISQEFKKSDVQTTQNWQQHLQMLCNEYKKNIDTLQKQYTKALINAICSQCKIDKQVVQRAVKNIQLNI